MVSFKYVSDENLLKVTPELEDIDFLILPDRIEMIGKKYFQNLSGIHKELFFNGFALHLKRSIKDKESTIINSFDFKLSVLERIFDQFLILILEEMEKFIFISEVKLDSEIFPDMPAIYLYAKN